MPTRSRFHGDVIPVVDGLLPYLLTPRCLQYAERHDTPMQRASILKCRNIIRVLRTHQPNLSYNQKTMELILTLLAEKTQSFSFRDEDEMKDWVACMSKRIRVALRHVQQAILKNPRSAWIREMFADAGHDAESGGQEQEGPAARGDGDDAIEVAERISKKRAPGETAASSGILSVAPSYLVGWCTEHKKAWRVNADAKNSPRLYTDVLELVDNGDEQVVMAAWPDGAKHQIEDLDVDEYNEMQMLAARKRKKALYSAPFEGGELRVCRAADRCPIYIIRYGATQICQLRVDTFDDERKSSRGPCGTTTRNSCTSCGTSSCSSAAALRTSRATRAIAVPTALAARRNGLPLPRRRQHVAAVAARAMIIARRCRCLMRALARG